MATLLFSALGSIFGGPIGGAIGALVGRSVDGAIFGGGSREGPRLKELSVTTSSYGTPVPRVFGRMRLAGTIIWSTDLIEHRDKQGGGKGKPSVTTYSYTASLAIALASRPLAGIGRIWADGNLLRGAAGDMKSAGSFRFHDGSGDQPLDPLLAAAEGEGTCPAYRGLAYVVFEDLPLGDFGNRIPALTFEVFADVDGFSSAELLEGVVDDVAATVTMPGLVGLSCEGALSDTLAQIDTAWPIDCDVSGNRLTLGRDVNAAPAPLREAAISIADDAFGSKQGYTRKRMPPAAALPEILRYYDIDRDYQPGLQRAPGRPRPGQPATVELAAAMGSANARQLIETIARRASWARQTMAWRTAEFDPAVRPGSLVTVPGEPGVWRVNDWEWRDSGIELSLQRTFGEGVAPAETSADAGRVMPPLDALPGETRIAAFELPWDGSGSGDTPLQFTATSSSSAGWKGAALFVDHGDGQLQALGPSGRARAVLGQAVTALAAASPHLFDRTSTVEIELASGDLALADSTPRQLAMGANRALLGSELIQFVKAVPLGQARWRLEGLLRGRGGTEWAIAGHIAGDPFVLLDGAATALDPAVVGDMPDTTIAAVGLGDAAPVTTAIALRGITRRPLTPVHPRAEHMADGSLVLNWTRRARGGWAWLDGVDLPLHEQAEIYEVTLGVPDSPLATWTAETSTLALSASQLAALPEGAAGAAFHVRQRGSYALSDPLLLTVFV
ncbi:MAG: phage tail protein [Novosphingobium sp.]